MNAAILGQKALVESFNAGQRLDHFIDALAVGASADEQASFVGAVDALIGLYAALRKAGMQVPAQDDPAMAQFMQSTNSTMRAMVLPRARQYDRAWLKHHLTALLRAVQPYAGANPATLPEVAPVAPPPMPVKVVGMPERLTSTSVTYDAQGNIKGSLQTEKDAPLPKG